MWKPVERYNRENHVVLHTLLHRQVEAQENQHNMVHWAVAAIEDN